MFSEMQLEKYAKVLWWGLQKARKKSFQVGDIVLLRVDLSAMDLAISVQKLLLEKGIFPVVRFNLPENMEKNFLSLASDEHLDLKLAGDKELYTRLNGLISLIAPVSLTHLKNIAPEKIARRAISQKYLREILEKHEADNSFSWTLCLYPTQVLADNANLSLAEYTQEIINATLIDSENPEEKWEEIYNKANEIKDKLNELDVLYFRIESKNIDLKIYIGEKRKWVGVSGHNIPSFELFVSPDFRLTEGIYFADQPSFRNGNIVKNARLEFKSGKVVKASAVEGEEFLQKQISMDAGAACLGEFSLTDKRFSKISKFMADTLFDENFGGEYGNCHIAIGASYADTYAGDMELNGELKQKLGFNDSALHWDLVNTEQKIVTVRLKNGEDKIIYKEGIFIL